MILAGAFTALAGPAHSRAASYAGFYGHQLDGELDPIYDVSNVRNVSNMGTPLAVVGPGVEFWTSFDDFFSQHWNLTLDLYDNYQMVMQTSSPNPNANIWGGNLIQWHLSGFDFPIQDVTKVSVPTGDRSTITFNSTDIWISFSGLAMWSGYTTYTFQIVPVPEPAVTSLFLAGSVLLALACRRRRGVVLDPAGGVPNPDSGCKDRPFRSSSRC